MSLVPIVLEKTPHGERSYDIFSRLLKDRIIMVNGEVRSEMASLIVAQLLFLESDDSKAEITMFVNSPGGSVTAGMSIIDTMNFVKPAISTIITGQAASMGSLIATSGTPGRRSMLPHATHMIHQPLGGFSGQASDAERHVKELVRWKTALTNIYVEATGKDYETLEADMDRDNFMTASESLAYGLVDEIVTKR